MPICNGTEMAKLIPRLGHTIIVDTSLPSVSKIAGVKPIIPRANLQSNSVIFLPQKSHSFRVFHRPSAFGDEFHIFHRQVNRGRCVRGGTSCLSRPTQSRA